MSEPVLRVCLVGPLPPPSGGMANQTVQLERLLAGEGIGIEVVQVNAPYRPAWAGHLRGIRALFRIIPYLARLWAGTGRACVVHVMANSGWAWHLFAAPAVWIARLRGVPVVVNYRGGAAEEFFRHGIAFVRPTMRAANRVVVPSGFLRDVFARFDLAAEIIPNVIDLGRFSPRPADARHTGAAHIVVTRNLEAIYDIATALEALALVRTRGVAARMTIAGEGPERGRLLALTSALGLDDHVQFTGRLANERIAGLYREADVSLNPSQVDNMPNSILESLASGVPVVSTNVGGVPYIVEDRVTALLVPPADPEAMARALIEVIGNPDLARRLARAGREAVQQYTWQEVRPRLLGVYRELAGRADAAMASGAS